MIKNIALVVLSVLCLFCMQGAHAHFDNSEQSTHYYEGINFAASTRAKEKTVAAELYCAEYGNYVSNNDYSLTGTFTLGDGKIGFSCDHETVNYTINLLLVERHCDYENTYDGGCYIDGENLCAPFEGLEADNHVPEEHTTSTIYNINMCYISQSLVDELIAHDSNAYNRIVEKCEQEEEEDEEPKFYCVVSTNYQGPGDANNDGCHLHSQLFYGGLEHDYIGHAENPFYIDKQQTKCGDGINTNPENGLQCNADDTHQGTFEYSGSEATNLMSSLDAEFGGPSAWDANQGATDSQILAASDHINTEVSLPTTNCVASCVIEGNIEGDPIEALCQCVEDESNCYCDYTGVVSGETCTHNNADGSAAGVGSTGGTSGGDGGSSGNSGGDTYVTNNLDDSGIISAVNQVGNDVNSVGNSVDGIADSLDEGWSGGADGIAEGTFEGRGDEITAAREGLGDAITDMISDSFGDHESMNLREYSLDCFGDAVQTSVVEFQICLTPATRQQLSMVGAAVLLMASFVSIGIMFRV